MSNVMAALPNIGGALCSTPQSLADAHYKMPYSNAANTRYPLKLAGCTKLTNRSQPLVGRSSPYCKYMWGRYCCLTTFFRLSICALVAKIRPDKFVRWCPDCEFLAIFRVLYFQRAACSRFQTCIGHTVDIQSATAEIRQGKKLEEERKKKEEITGQKYNDLPYCIGPP